jgi:hypothetical protein
MESFRKALRKAVGESPGPNAGSPWQRQGPAPLGRSGADPSGPPPAQRIGSYFRSVRGPTSAP